MDNNNDPTPIPDMTEFELKTFPELVKDGTSNDLDEIQRRFAHRRLVGHRSVDEKSSPLLIFDEGDTVKFELAVENSVRITYDDAMKLFNRLADVRSAILLRLVRDQGMQIHEARIHSDLEQTYMVDVDVTGSHKGMLVEFQPKDRTDWELGFTLIGAMMRKMLAVFVNYTDMFPEDGPVQIARLK